MCHSNQFKNVIIFEMQSFYIVMSNVTTVTYNDKRIEIPQSPSAWRVERFIITSSPGNVHILVQCSLGISHYIHTDDYNQKCHCLNIL